MYKLANKQTPKKYPDLSFIVDLTAVVEKVWLSAARIVTRDRASLYPKMLEAILLLKFNKELWDNFDIADTLALIKKNINKNLQKQLILSDCFNNWMEDFENID